MSGLGIDGRKARLPALILALIACLGSLTLTGCGQPLSEGGQTSAGGVNAPVALNYTVNNPLTWNEISEEEGEEFSYRYIKISGLADKEVESAINDRIKAVYDELRIQDLPPYRGIKRALPEGAVLGRESIYTEVTGNFNNILSVTLNKYNDYRQALSPEEEKGDPYGGVLFFSETEALNFDLRTGKEIKLTDLFCDNVEPMELVNGAMKKVLSETYAEDEGYFIGAYSGLKLVGPFRGLSEDQKFAVYPHGIMLIFDYETPQFDTGNMTVPLLLYFSDFPGQIAAGERFFREEENIFTSEGPRVKALVMHNMKNDISGMEYTSDEVLNLYRSWGYSSDLPEKITGTLDRMKEVDQDQLEAVRQRFKAMAETQPDRQDPWSLETMIYGNKTGSYINISKNTMLYGLSFFEQEAEFHCYDEETLKELQLSDIFQEGYDYKKVIIEALKRERETYLSPSGEDGANQKQTGEDGSNQRQTGEDSPEQYEAMINSIGGFNLSAEALTVSVVHPKEGTGTYGLYIPFQDFDCDNMTIFKN